ncbi:MAG TPA: universal stress protein [Acetobacteraceae bacterium]|nr:universal stress protein [Acetobacteraceae bacterium]
MALRDILVVLDASARNEARLTLAMALARRHGAGLNGFCAMGLLSAPEPAQAPPRYPEPFGLQGIANIAAESPVSASAFESITSTQADLADRIGEAFRETARQATLRATYESDLGPPAASIVQRARTADLVVMGQPDPEDPHEQAARRAIEDVLLLGGRPVLVVPYAGNFPSVGKTVLIGWSETREAARAAHDALALMEPDAKATLLTIHRGPLTPEGEALPAAEAARHFARHGIDAEPAETVPEAVGAPTVIVRPTVTEAGAFLNYASDLGADLLVIGGYGHSRARELVLGGMTRSLLNTTTLPLLMSH